MNSGKIVFSQIMDLVPWKPFNTCVERYQGDRKVQHFTCAEFFRIMAFAQLTYRESLRDIVTCLEAMRSKLYHMGIRSNVTRSNLSLANNTRDWRIFADFAQVLIQRAKDLYADQPIDVDVDAKVFAIDSSTIDLCLTLFPWAKFRKTKSAIKLHTMIDLQGSIPDFVLITPGKMQDPFFLDHLAFQTGAFYVMDRGYLDYGRLYTIHQSKAFFVTRAKKNTRFRRRYSNEIDPSSTVRSDQIGVLDLENSFNRYPDSLRRVSYYDQENDKRLVFLTNNVDVPASTVAELYRSRWKIELFFKWIKQHLRIKKFYGWSDNAVKSQIWIAICIYLLVAILKQRLGIDRPLYNILQVLSLTQFEKTPVFQVFSDETYNTETTPSHKQLLLFDL
jgi:hypothetical protein